MEETTYYGYIPGTWFLKKMPLNYIVINRDLTTRKIPNASIWKHVVRIAEDSHLVPTTHHVSGTLIVYDKIISIRDINLLLSLTESDMPNDMYQWYYHDVFDSSELVTPNIPSHMIDLFKKTKTWNIARSPDVRIVAFKSLPEIHKNVTPQILPSLALNHLTFRNTNKVLINDFIIPNPLNEHISTIDTARDGWDVLSDDAISNLKRFQDVTDEAIIAKQKYILLLSDKLKIREINAIKEELQLSEYLLSTYLQQTDKVQLIPLMDWLAQLKLLNQSLSSIYQG